MLTPVVVVVVVVVVAELSLALNNIKVDATCSKRHHLTTTQTMFRISKPKNITAGTRS